MASYEHQPMLLKEYTSKSIQLPRFQRKNVWNDSRKFLLGISIFKNYPTGVSIIWIQNNQKWLLDGRQRRNAITEIMNNPMKMYEWATTTLRFSEDNPDPKKAGKKIGKKADKDEFFEAFIRFLKGFCESDDDFEELDENEDTSNTDSDFNEACVDGSAIGNDYTVSDGYIQQLIDMLLLCNANKGTGFLDAFNFSKSLPKYRMQYMKKGSDSKKVDALLLTQFLCRFCDTSMDRGEGGKIKKESFLNYMLCNQFLNDDESVEYATISTEISSRWEKTILPALTIFSNYYDVFMKASIGIILVKDAFNSDAQKIFNLINTQGVKLTQAEIMSSKASWNVVVENTSDETKEYVRKMYDAWEIPFNGKVVAWDYPAVFMDILKTKSGDKSCFFFSYQRDTAIKSIIVYNTKTIGFQILSAIYKKSIKKDDMDLLVQDVNDWGQEIGVLIDKICVLFSTILDHPFFKLLGCYFLKKDSYQKTGHNYGKSIQKLLTDAISIYFVVQLYLYANERDYLSSPSPKGRQSIKRNAFILFDRLVYECIKGLWSGSSDSRISTLLTKPMDSEYFTPVSDESWKSLIQEINNKGTIDGSTIKDQGKLEPLVYYIHCLNEVAAGNYENGFDVDHIIPQDAFKGPGVQEKDKALENSLFNLELLPLEINRKKKDNLYDDIWDKKLDATEKNICLISSFFLSPEELRLNSKINRLSEFKEKRCTVIMDALEKRHKNMDIKNN